MFKGKQLDKLVQAGIISAEQKEQILDFENHKKGTMITRMLNLLGVFTVGIGIISVIAANWNIIGSGMKLFVMFLLLILSTGVAFYWQQHNQPEKAERVLVGLFLLIGAAIGLIIQVFQLSGGKWYSVLGLWCLFGLPLLFVAQKKYVSCFFIPLFLYWCAACMRDMLGKVGLSALFDPFGDFMLYDIALFTAFVFLAKMLTLYAPQFSFGDVLRRYSLFAAYLCLALYIIFAWKIDYFYRLVIAAAILVGTSLIYKHYGAYHLIRRNIKFGGLIVAMLYLNFAYSFGLLHSGIGLIISGAGLIVLVKQWPKVVKLLTKGGVHV